MKTKTTQKTEESSVSCNCSCGDYKYRSSDNHPVYGIGLIGAAFYFLPGSVTLQDWLWHIFQTISWPGFLVYEILKFFKV